MEATANPVMAMAAIQSHRLRTPLLSSSRIFWKLCSLAPWSGLRAATCSWEGEEMSGTSSVGKPCWISTEISSSSKQVSGGMGRALAVISPDSISCSTSTSGGLGVWVSRVRACSAACFCTSSSVGGGGQVVMV